jgi:hypothetical protein
VQLRVVGQPIDRPEPDGLVGDVLAVDRQIDRRGDVPHVEGALAGPVLGYGMRDVLERRGRVRQRLGLGEVGRHADLVVESLVLVLERRDHRQDGQPALVRLGAPRGERTAVVDAVHRERDGQVHVSRSQEVCVHRVDVPILGNRARSGDDRLREHLSAEDAPERHPLRRPGEDVLTGACSGVGQIERRQQ